MGAETNCFVSMLIWNVRVYSAIYVFIVRRRFTSCRDSHESVSVWMPFAALGVVSLVLVFHSTGLSARADILIWIKSKVCGQFKDNLNNEKRDQLKVSLKFVRLKEKVLVTNSHSIFNLI